MDIQENISEIKKTHKMLQEIKSFPTKSNTLAQLDIKNHPAGKTHQIAVTGIIQNSEGKYLICRRSPNESAFPNKWCVPGGKLETSDFIQTQKDTSNHWLNILEKTLKREVEEETSLKIKDIGYTSNLAFIHPNGNSSIIISLHAKLESGKVKLDEKELTKHAWVTPKEAESYDLIENILEQIQKTDKINKRNQLK